MYNVKCVSIREDIPWQLIIGKTYYVNPDTAYYSPNGKIYVEVFNYEDDDSIGCLDSSHFTLNGVSLETILRKKANEDSEEDPEDAHFDDGCPMED